MAVFLTMVATIFHQAGTAFSFARSSVEIHQNARAALEIMLRDFTAAQLCSYDDKVGYFAIGWRKDADSGDDVQAITFTTLAEQPGAKSTVTGAGAQVALVRYALQFSGATVTIEGDDPSTLSKVEDEHAVRIFNLIKQVRFPLLAQNYCDMSEFDDSFITDEDTTTDILAMGVYDMWVRIYYKGHYVEVLDYGRADTGTGALALVENGKDWPVFLPADTTVRPLGGDGAPQEARDIASNTATQLNASFSPAPDEDTTYRIEQDTSATEPDPLQPENETPGWLEVPRRGDTIVPGKTYEDARMYPMIVIERVPAPSGSDRDSMEIRMPYLVEVTLMMAHRQAKTKRTFTFTQRFNIPSATQ